MRGVDRTTTIVILIAVSILILGAVYLVLHAQQASIPTQIGALGLSATILGLLATYFTAILEEPEKAPPSGSASGEAGAESPSESSTAKLSPSTSDATANSPAPQKTEPSFSPEADGRSSINSPKPLEKGTAWQHIRATNSSYRGLCMEAEGGAVITATCSDSKDQLWKTTARGEIITRDGRCLTSTGVGGGQTMLTQACTGRDGQKWKSRDGRIWLGSLCLTIRGPSTTPGSAIQTWNTEEDPKPADEMYWSLSG
ncbi:RICIN domain-containing protein [Streptomyces collinus]|uniref:RICIN domain-containing protein n=1 Tax=Streptomyces collinus TaxID=42684 RepID=UPI00365FF49D